jgi:hypothetical protein
MLAMNIQLLLNLKTYNNGTETLPASFSEFLGLVGELDWNKTTRVAVFQ